MKQKYLKGSTGNRIGERHSDMHDLKTAYWKYVLLAVFVSVGVRMYAQADEFATWSMIRVNHKILPDLKFSAAVEFRSKADLKQADRWGGDAGIMYNLLPCLQVEGVYELHYRRLDKGEWKFRHRYNLGVQVSANWGDFKISLRERFQETFSEGNVENRLRSRLKVSYGPSGWRVKPYFAPELYQPIGDRAFFRVARMRYRPGIEIKLSGRCSADVFYCRQYEPGNSRNIFGIEVGVSL